MLAYDCTMTLELTPALEQDLKHLASETHSSIDQVAQQALESYVAYKLSLSAIVKRGDADIAAGRLISSEEMLERIERNFA